MARHRHQRRNDTVRLLGTGAPGAVSVADLLPERDFQRTHVVEGLKRRGFTVWTVPNMKLTTAGLPDVLAYCPRLPGLLLAWELKSATGRPTWKQRRALTHLSTVAGVDARLVRPRHWPALRDALDAPDPVAALAAIPREV